MVVCKCRKGTRSQLEFFKYRFSDIRATKLYCFVHKVPVCGECICFPEHQLCVVKTYSEWVIDGEYDWPPTCSMCHADLAAEKDAQTTRLGCLHVIHTKCLVSHIQSFPPQTSPSGYVCPTCSSALWPPKNFKDTQSLLHSKLKEAIIQSELEKNIFGNHLVNLPSVESRSPPPAFTSDPLARLPKSDEINGNDSDIIEIEGPDRSPNFINPASPTPGATTRKGGYNADRQSPEISYYADDEDGDQKKYSRRGPIRHKFLRFLLPFWSSSLPTLPVTAPPRKDGHAEDLSEGRTRHQRSSRVDPRRIMLYIAITACLATIGILYYRLAQSVLSGDLPLDESQ